MPCPEVISLKLFCAIGFSLPLSRALLILLVLAGVLLFSV